jgi:hypothetical protein
MSTDLEIFLIDIENAKTRDAAYHALRDFMATEPSEDENDAASARYLKWLYIYRHGKDVAAA